MLLKNLHTRLSKVRNSQDESGVALIAVILVTMLLLMTTLLISLTVMTTQNQTKDFNMNQQARATADTGLNTFLAAVNTSQGYTMLETYKTASTQGSEAQRETPSNALCKTVTASVNQKIGYYPRWCTWTVKVSSGTGTSGYYVYAKGFTGTSQTDTARSNPDNEVTLRVFIEPIAVDSFTTTSNGKVVYYLPSSAPFQLGVTGGLAARFEAGSKLYTNQFLRNSTPIGEETALTSVASDELISLYPNMKVGTLVAPASTTVAEICTPINSAECTDPIHRISPISSSMQTIKDNIDAECPNAAGTYPTWRATENGTSTIQPGCYNNIFFDRDMTVSANYSQSAPLKIYAKGTVTFDTNVNTGAGRDPAAFQIRSTGSVIWRDVSSASASLSTKTSTNAYIASYSECATLLNLKRTLLINGALACSSVNIGKNTIMYMDTKSQQYGIEIVNGAPARSIWFASGIEQV